MDDRIAQAGELARAGDRVTARALLQQVLRTDPRNEQAWLLYADIASSRDECIEALEACLRLVPDARRARAGLEMLRKQDEQATHPTALGWLPPEPAEPELPAPLVDPDAMRLPINGNFPPPPRKFTGTLFEGKLGGPPEKTPPSADPLDSAARTAPVPTYSAALGAPAMPDSAAQTEQAAALPSAPLPSAPLLPPDQPAEEPRPEDATRPVRVGRPQEGQPAPLHPAAPPPSAPDSADIPWPWDEPRQPPSASAPAAVNQPAAAAMNQPEAKDLPAANEPPSAPLPPAPAKQQDTPLTPAGEGAAGANAAANADTAASPADPFAVTAPHVLRTPAGTEIPTQRRIKNPEPPGTPPPQDVSVRMMLDRLPDQPPASGPAFTVPPEQIEPGEFARIEASTESQLADAPDKPERMREMRRERLQKLLELPNQPGADLPEPPPPQPKRGPGRLALVLYILLGLIGILGVAAVLYGLLMSR